MSSHAIEVNQLLKTYGSFVAVRDVTFQVQQGEIFGYLGANGAGKSTTIRMLCGLVRPSGGSAQVAGYDVAHASARVKGSIGYMSQKFSLYLDLDARDNLAFFGGIYGLRGAALRAALERVVHLTDLSPYCSHLTSALPGGIRQRLALACSILHQPKILFLDEPTAGVDPASRRMFWRLIRQLAQAGTTIFVTTHYMDEAEYCARIGLMVDGQLTALDTPEALKRRFVPGTTVAFYGQRLERMVQLMRDQPFVRSAALFGASLQVRYEERATNEQTLRSALTAAGAQVTGSEQVEATLEDVFLEVVSQASGKGAQA